MMADGGYAGCGEARVRMGVGTAGQAATLLGALDPDAPVSCLVRDSGDREFEGAGLVIETVIFDTGWQFAWLTVDLPLAVPDGVRDPGSGEALEDAWEERAWSGGCPLAAVTALIARRGCSADGCAAYGTRECSASGRADRRGGCGA